MIDIKKMKVVLIDDNESFIYKFDEYLREINLNYSLKSFVCTYKAIDYIKRNKHNIDCVFMNYELPRYKGLELFEKINYELSPETPVLITASHGDGRLAVEIVKAGAFDYFTKKDVTPEFLEKIFHKIEQLIKINAKTTLVEKELYDQRVFLSKITKLNPAIIYVYDKEQDEFIYINHSWRDFLGFSKGKNENMDLSSILDYACSNSKDVIKNNFKKKLFSSSYTGGEIEFNLRNADGGTNWFKSTEKAFKIGGGVVKQVLGVAIDISKQKEYEKEVSLERAKALKAASVKSEFLSNMSHEIRTPMNAILGLTDILMKTNTFEGQNLENINSIKYSAEYLLIIINDILELTKIEAGKLSLEKLDFSLKEKLENIKRMMGFKASEKGISFNINIEKGTPEYLKGDPYRLDQILINVASNAIKFTHSGFVTINVKDISTNRDSIWLQFDIIDTGIGMSEASLSKIFDSYTQAYTDTTRLYGGTGLGLTITKKLVEYQKGEISVASEQDKGTKFTINLPFDIGKFVNAKEDSKEDIINDIEGMRVLVAEDNVINQLVIKQVLSGWKCVFDIANDGGEAVDFFEKNKYDIVVLDLQMPKMNGFDAIKQIRKIGQRGKDIYILALTADIFPETKDKVMETGFDNFITKPFVPKELKTIFSNEAYRIKLKK